MSLQCMSLQALQCLGGAVARRCPGAFLLKAVQGIILRERHIGGDQLDEPPSHFGAQEEIEGHGHERPYTSPHGDLPNNLLTCRCAWEK